MRIGFTLTNFSEFAGVLRDLPAAVESRVMGDAVGAAAKPIVRAAKSRAAVRTGALKRSLTAIVKRYPQKGKVMAIIGPDRDFYSSGKRVKKGASAAGADRPAKYAHLVEFGHHTVDSSVGQTRAKGRFTKGKPTATAAARKFIPARPFLRPAVSAATPEAERELATGVEKGMEREIKRLASKMKRIAKKS